MWVQFRGRLPGAHCGCPEAGLGSPTQVSSLPTKDVSSLWPPFPVVGSLMTIADKQSGLLTPDGGEPGGRGWHLIKDSDPCSPLVPTLQAVLLCRKGGNEVPAQSISLM